MLFLAIILLPQGPELKPFKTYDTNFCKNTSGDDFIQCIEEGAFMANDILENDKVNARPIYLSDDVGLLSQILEIAPGVITKDFWTSLKIRLNSSMNYQMSIVGQNLQFLFASPTIPRSFMKPPRVNGIFAFYMKVKR